MQASIPCNNGIDCSFLWSVLQGLFHRLGYWWVNGSLSGFRPCHYEIKLLILHNMCFCNCFRADSHGYSHFFAYLKLDAVGSYLSIVNKAKICVTAEKRVFWCTLQIYISEGTHAYQYVFEMISSYLSRVILNEYSRSS